MELGAKPAEPTDHRDTHGCADPRVAHRDASAAPRPTPRQQQRPRHSGPDHTPRRQQGRQRRRRNLTGSSSRGTRDSRAAHVPHRPPPRGRPSGPPLRRHPPPRHGGRLLPRRSPRRPLGPVGHPLRQRAHRGATRGGHRRGNGHRGMDTAVPALQHGGRLRLQPSPPLQHPGLHQHRAPDVRPRPGRGHRRQPRLEVLRVYGANTASCPPPPAHVARPSGGPRPRSSRQRRHPHPRPPVPE